MPRVALISTYPPAECGIANYSHQLLGALADGSETEVVVLAERAGDAVGTHTIRHVWHRRGDWVNELDSAIGQANPEVVHVQHEESILGQDGRLPALLHRLRARGLKTVVTLHSVYDRRVVLPGWVAGKSFHRRLAAACDRIVVHQRAGMADTLAAHGVAGAQIAVIPHGTPRMKLPSRADARAVLGLPADAPVALFFGFIHRRKGLHVALSAFERAAVADAKFVIAGRVRRKGPIDALYASALARQMRAGIAGGRILYRPGFVAAEHKATYFAAADVLVLPHEQTYGSASGVLHEALGAGRAILCTRGKKFAEAVEHFANELPDAFPSAGEVEAWQRGLAQLLTDAPMRARVAELARGLAEQTSWATSASRHVELYRELAHA